MHGGRLPKEKRPKSAGLHSCRTENDASHVARSRTDRTAPLMSATPDPPLRHHRREQGMMLALALPALLVVVLLLVLPVGWLAWQSIYHDGFTLENYRRILSEDIYWRSFLLIFEVSLLVTLLALMLGYPIAYAAHSAPKRWSVIILALVILPFWTSVLVRAYAWLALLQRTGVINQLLQTIGIIDEPLSLVH